MSAPRQPLGRAAAAVVLLCSALALLWVVAVRPTLGVSTEHFYPYNPVPRWPAMATLLAMAMPLVGAAAFALLWRRPLSSLKQALVVGLMVVGSLLLHTTAALAPRPYAGAQLAWPFLWANTEGSYAFAAPQARRTADFVSNYPHWLDVSPVRESPHWVHVHHGQVHPPGPILAFVWFERLYDACPRLEAAAARWVDERFPTVQVLRQPVVLHQIRHQVTVAMTAALATIVLASLAPLACFAVAREVWPPRLALVAAGLAALVPGTYLFNPSIDQAYPAVVLLCCWLWLRALRTGRWAWGFAFGALVYGAVFFHVGLALAVAILSAAALVAWRTDRPEWSLAEVVRRHWRLAMGAAFGFLTPAFALQVWLGYPTLRVVRLCLRNNVLFNAEVRRTYWPWLGVGPLEFGISLGAALLMVVSAGWVLEVVAAARRRSLEGRAPLLLAAGTVLLALHLVGMNRGETPRLWLFVTPLLVLGAADFVVRQVGEWRRLLCAVCAAQLVQIVVFAVALDVGRTTSFFVDLLAKQ